MTPIFEGRVIDDSKPSNFLLLPDGEYRVKILEILPKPTRAGDEMWRVKYEVLGKGKIIYDNVVWSERGAAGKRLKQFLKCFGLYHEEKFEYKPFMFMGKEATVFLTSEVSQQGKWAGKTFNKIPFDGYYTYSREKDEDIPF